MQQQSCIFNAAGSKDHDIGRDRAHAAVEREAPGIPEPVGVDLGQRPAARDERVVGGHSEGRDEFASASTLFATLRVCHPGKQDLALPHLRRLQSFGSLRDCG